MQTNTMRTYRIASPLICALLLFTSNYSVAVEPLKFESTDTQVRLIELYTSEGCYSCPPADAWIRKLKTDKRLWKEFVPTAFHVDYWDYIGWKDPYASAENTNRQHRYASVLGMRTVYTPGFFLNGKEWRGFFNKRFIPSASTTRTGKLKATLLKKNIQLNFKPVSRNKYYEVNIAVLGFDLSSKIIAGENEGKTLQHDFVVLGHKTASLVKNTSSEFSLSTTLPAFKDHKSKLGLAVWVTEQGSPVPVQSMGGWMNTSGF